MDLIVSQAVHAWLTAEAQRRNADAADVRADWDDPEDECTTADVLEDAVDDGQGIPRAVLREIRAIAIREGWVVRLDRPGVVRGGRKVVAFRMDGIAYEFERCAQVAGVVCR